jgi:hypothetical protein
MKIKGIGASILVVASLSVAAHLGKILTGQALKIKTAGESHRQLVDKNNWINAWAGYPYKPLPR